MTLHRGRLLPGCVLLSCVAVAFSVSACRSSTPVTTATAVQSPAVSETGQNLPVDLSGPFPVTFDTGSDIIHVRSVEWMAESQITLSHDYWFQPSSGKYKQETSRPGEGVTVAMSFNGKRLVFFDRDSGAADYSVEAYRASPLAWESDATKDIENPLASAAKDVRDKVAAGRLVKESTEVTNGRESVRYRLVASAEDLTKWVVADEATGLPLEETTIRKADGAVLTSKAYDYEVIPETSADASTFDLAIPAGVIPRTDKDLPIDPSTLELSAEQAARECSFEVFWLGDEYQGVPLHKVKVTPNRSSVRLYYVHVYGSPEAKAQGPKNIDLYEFSSKDLLVTLLDGLSAAGATSEEQMVGGRPCQLWTGGSIAPTVVLAQGATTIALSGTPGEPDAEAEVQRVLRAAQDLVKVRQ